MPHEPRRHTRGLRRPRAGVGRRPRGPHADAHSRQRGERPGQAPASKAQAAAGLTAPSGGAPAAAALAGGRTADARPPPAEAATPTRNTAADAAPGGKGGEGGAGRHGGGGADATRAACLHGHLGRQPRRRSWRVCGGGPPGRGMRRGRRRAGRVAAAPPLPLLRRADWQAARLSAAAAADPVPRGRRPHNSPYLPTSPHISPHLQCHAAGRLLPAPPHRLLVVREGGRVVAAALLLHVAPRRRQSDDTRFSQTTLFAVDESEERRRIGRLRRRAQPALLCMSKEG